MSVGFEPHFHNLVVGLWRENDDVDYPPMVLIRPGTGLCLVKLLTRSPVVRGVLSGAGAARFQHCCF